MNDSKEAGKQAATLKTRRLVFEQAVTLEEAESLIAILESADVSAKVIGLEVSYDLAGTDLEGIEKLLQTANVRLGMGPRARLSRAWLHYAEESEISNLNAPSKNASCCNRPPVK
ncbi:MAG: hypothetical protein HY016_13010 [Nitrosomonadales bacterium]|jgi:hypothetical protein|nr:hypothetical protein [Nitrosomonadales bacterium]MBI3481251.1 hypothetical protein [Nitrosomonadales bacterium]